MIQGHPVLTTRHYGSVAGPKEKSLLEGHTAGNKLMNVSGHGVFRDQQEVLRHGSAWNMWPEHGRNE